MKNEESRSAVRWLYRLSKPQLPAVGVIILLDILSAVIGVGFALLYKNVVDSAIGRDLSMFFRQIAYLAGAILIQLGISFATDCIEMRTTALLEQRLKTNLLEKLLSKDYLAVSGYHSGDLMMRLTNDTRLVAEKVTSLLPTVFSQIARLLCAAAVLVVLDRTFALVFFAAGILVLVFARLLRKYLKKLHKDVQQADGTARSFFQEVIENNLMIKAFRIQKQTLEKSERLQEAFLRKKLKRRYFSSFVNGGVSFLFEAGYLYALSWCAYKIYKGLISVGTLTAVLQLVSQVQAPFASLSGVLPQYYAMLASAERLMEIEQLKEEPPVTTPMLASDTPFFAITLSGVSFGYGTDLILKDVSMQIQKGEFLAISGISGIGKSTLLKLLLGIFPPDTGSIEVNTPQGSLPLGSSTRALFTYVPQGNFLLSGTVREIFTLIDPTVSDERIFAALAISCADSFVDKLPDRLDTVIGEKGFGLSEGQVQRLAIARALLTDAQVLLLDEATSALDEATEKQVLLNIRAQKDKTCIIVSHKKAALMLCDREIRIVDGQLTVHKTGESHA